MKIFSLLLFGLISLTAHAGPGNDEGKTSTNGCNAGYAKKACSSDIDGCTAAVNTQFTDYCVLCPADTYSEGFSLAARGECTACESGKTTNSKTGSTSAEACVDGQNGNSATTDAPTASSSSTKAPTATAPSPSPAPAPAASVCEKLKKALPSTIVENTECHDSPAGAKLTASLSLVPEYPTGTQTAIEAALSLAGVPTPLKVELKLNLEFDLCGADAENPMKFAVSMSEENLGLDDMKIFEMKGGSGELTKTFNSPITVPPAPSPGVVFVVFKVTMSGDTASSKIKVSIDLLTKYPFLQVTPSPKIISKEATIYSHELFSEEISLKTECDKNHKGYDCFKTSSPTNVNGKGSEFDTCVPQTLVRKAAADGGMKAAGAAGEGGSIGGAFAGALVLGLVVAGAGVGLAVKYKVFSVNEEKVKELKDKGSSQVKGLKEKVKGLKKPSTSSEAPDTKDAAFDMNTIEEGKKDAKVVKANPVT